MSTMPLVRCRFLPQPHLGENNQQITVKIDIIKGSFASNHFTALLGFITSNNQTTIFLLCGCCFSIPSLSENCSRSVFIAQKSLKHAFLPKLIPPNSEPHLYHHHHHYHQQHHDDIESNIRNLKKINRNSRRPIV